MAAKAAIVLSDKENPMLAVKKIKEGIKSSFLTILELAHVRLDMARIELVQQKNYLITTVVTVLIACICLLVAFISLLFGLASVLSPDMQKVVFFSISGGALFFCLLMLLIMWNSLKKQSDFMSLTLNEVRRDIIAIKNTLQSSKQSEGGE